MSKTAEERARATVELLESDFGQSGKDVWFYAIRDELRAHAIAAVMEDRAFPSTVHATVEKWLLDYQAGRVEPGDCKSIMENIVCAHAHAALEHAAEIVRMYKVANFSVAPHHRLVPAEPDAASETMAAAILALREEG